MAGKKSYSYLKKDAKNGQPQPKEEGIRKDEGQSCLEKEAVKEA